MDPLHRRINGRQQLLLISFQAPFQALGTRQDLAKVAAEAVALPRHRQQQGIDGRFETEIDLGSTWDLAILLGIMGPDGIFWGGRFVEVDLGDLALAGDFWLDET